MNTRTSTEGSGRSAGAADPARSVGARPRSSARVSRTSDRYFFSAFALYYLVTMLIGFGHSTAQVMERDGGLRTIAIVHGIVGTVWLLLYVTQTWLIAGRRWKLHMTLGVAGLPVMVGVFVTGIIAVFRLHLPAENLPIGLMHSEVALFTLGLVYAVLGIGYRKRVAWHKRFLLMSMILLSPAGIARVVQFIGYEPASVVAYLFIIFLIPLFAIVVYDLVAYRKVFGGTIIGLVLYALNLALGGVWGELVVNTVRPLLL